MGCMVQARGMFGRTRGIDRKIVRIRGPEQLQGVIF